MTCWSRAGFRRPFRGFLVAWSLAACGPAPAVTDAGVGVGFDAAGAMDASTTTDHLLPSGDAPSPLDVQAARDVAPLIDQVDAPDVPGSDASVLGPEAGPPADASSAGPDPTGVLLSANGAVHFVRFDGTIAAVVPLPTIAGADVVRGIVEDANGLIHVFDGSDTPTLATYDRVSATWSTAALAGWSTFSCGPYGHLAATPTAVIATDMMTSGGPESGLVRFPLNGGAPDRPVTGIDFTDVTFGLDGRIYGLNGSLNQLLAYDPNTFAPSGMIPAQQSLGVVAVDADGTIFSADPGLVTVFAQDGSVTRMAAAAAHRVRLRH